MASALSAKELDKVLDDLESQGCSIKRVKKGYMIFFPNGDSTCFHATPSDYRAIMNMRSRVIRANLTWLPDGKSKK